MNRLHFVVPSTVGDPRRPSGGNVYDRALAGALCERGWQVSEVGVPGNWSAPGASELRSLGSRLSGLPPAETVLVDGLLASAAPEVLARRARGRPLVVLVHLPLGVGSPGPVRRRERAALTTARALVATSAWTRAWLVDTYGIPADRVRVARPGVEPAVTTCGSGSAGSLVCVGALSPVKGHDVLVSALERVTDLPWTCRIIGSLEVAPDFAAAIVDRVRRAGLSGRVHVEGPMARGPLMQALSAADLVVQPSRLESYGMVLAEALARGVPVLAADTGGVREAVGLAPDGSLPGILVPGGSAAFAAAIRSWLAEPALRRELRRAAAARSSLTRSWSGAATVVSEVLVDVAR